MAKYLIHGNYLADGINGLLKEGGTGRRAAVEKLAASMGGTVESFYYSFGETDLYVIFDMPDHSSMAAAVLAAGASGAVTIKTSVLMTAEEMDDAVKKTSDYRAPGQ